MMLLISDVITFVPLLDDSPMATTDRVSDVPVAPNAGTRRLWHRRLSKLIAIDAISLSLIL
jgi:hypothetical protein